MDSDALNTFLVVHRRGGISSAAKVLHRSQPAITRRINLLEGQLGVPLFERGRGGAMLTEAGRILYRHAEAIAARMVDAQAPGVAGTLRRLSPLPVSGDGWPGRLPAEYAQLHLLARAYGAMDGLPAPLALYLFTHDDDVKARVLGATDAGGVTVNGVLSHMLNDALPFGGIGASGMGTYHGHAGFLAFSHVQSRLDHGTARRPVDRLTAPYTPFFDRLVDGWLR